MNMFRIALVNIRFPATPEESVTLAEQAIAQASIERAGLICFPECFVPGYRGLGISVPPPDTRFLERAWLICFPECFVPGYRGLGKSVPPPDTRFLERAWSAIRVAAAKAN